ncbi:hypothetical protein ANMWB30_27520 [Arthrobacter sp. MWB30]|nr:hypothetical protein ANMWB30_27520 [Arthrobacter sp. MWB30]
MLKVVAGLLPGPNPGPSHCKQTGHFCVPKVCRRHADFS